MGKPPEFRGIHILGTPHLEIHHSVQGREKWWCERNGDQISAPEAMVSHGSLHPASHAQIAVERLDHFVLDLWADAVAAVAYPAYF